MKKLIRTIPSMIAPFAAAICLLLSPVAVHAEGSIESGADAAHGTGQPTTLIGDGSIFTRVTDILLYIVGILSVIMLIIGGLRYVLSGGNSTAVTAAKNTILYAIVGVIVAILAYAIIHFVINALIGGGVGGGSGGTNV